MTDHRSAASAAHHGRLLRSRLGLLLGLLLTPLLSFASGWTPGHYLYYQQLQSHFSQVPIGTSTVGAEFRGAVVSYTWSLLEKNTLGNFADGFAAIDRDIATLSSVNKKLIIFIKYKTFQSGANYTPAYITHNNPTYGGGTYTNRWNAEDPVMWEPAVRARMQALLTALGTRYNNNSTVEAILLPESAAQRPLNETGGQNETTFNTALALQGTYTHYSKTALTTQIKAYVQTMGTAFPNTATALYATGHDMLDQLVSPTLSEQMSTSDVGLGNPDIIPTYTNNEYNATGSAYDHYPAKSNLEPLIPQLQNPDWSRTYLNGTPVPIVDFYNHTKSNLKATHMVWDLTGRTGVDAQVRSFLTPLIASDPAGGLNAQVPSSMPSQPTPLAAPANLAATANGTTVTLSWTDVATTNTGYKIERRAPVGPNGLIGLYTQIGTAGANATGYTDSTAAATTEYDYIVRAYDATRNSAYAGPVTVTTGASSLVKLAVSASTASSVYQSNVSTFSHDGNTTTRWGSTNTAAQWIRYDLGSSKTVKEVRLMMYNGATRAYTLKVEVGNGTTWTQVWAGTTALNAGLQTLNVTDATNRYVRLTTTAPNSNGNNFFSIYETEIWGN